MTSPTAAVAVAPIVRVATHDAETVAAIHAALDARQPIALLHAKLPADEQARQRALVEAATFTADDAVILFTSGSTGSSRGVVLSRAAIDAAADASWAHLGVRAGDRWLCTLPMAHAGGLSIVVRCRARDVECVLAADNDPADRARARARATSTRTIPDERTNDESEQRADASGDPDAEQREQADAALRGQAGTDQRGQAGAELRGQAGAEQRADSAAGPCADDTVDVRAGADLNVAGALARARARDTSTRTIPDGRNVVGPHFRSSDRRPQESEWSIPEDITLASLVPAQLADLLADEHWRPSRDLRAVLLGGAAAPPSLVEAALARGVPVLPTYGLTETFGQIATAREPGGPLHLLPGVSIAGGTRAEPARLTIRGPMLASRYLDGTPIAPALATSDLGFVENGVLHVIGRADDVIITGGENVHPAQVEAVLAATPGVRAAVAFGVPDERWGQLVAAALAVDASFDRGAALARWHANLPPFARPRRLAVARELPRLPSGKLDRRQVVTLATSPIDYP